MKNVISVRDLEDMVRKGQDVRNLPPEAIREAMQALLERLTTPPGAAGRMRMPQALQPVSALSARARARGMPVRSCTNLADLEGRLADLPLINDEVLAEQGHGLGEHLEHPRLAPGAVRAHRGGVERRGPMALRISPTGAADIQLPFLLGIEVHHRLVLQEALLEV